MGEKILILIIAREINPLVPSARVIYKEISSVWKAVTQVTSMLVVLCDSQPVYVRREFPCAHEAVFWFNLASAGVDMFLFALQIINFRFDKHLNDKKRNNSKNITSKSMMWPWHIQTHLYLPFSLVSTTSPHPLWNLVRKESTTVIVV